MVLCANVLYLYNTLHEVLLSQRISAVHHLLQDSCQNNLNTTHNNQDSKKVKLIPASPTLYNIYTFKG